MANRVGLLRVTNGFVSWVVDRNVAMKGEVDEVVELANRYECSEQTVFERCLEIYTGTPDNEKAAQDLNHYTQTGWIPHYVRHYYRNLEPLPDDGFQKFIKMVARFFNNGGSNGK